MNEDKSKLKLIGENAEANNKNLELIQEINELQDKLETYEKENQRLNNVLNELEKILIEDYKWLDEYGDALAGCAMGEIKRIQKKLNELKESDK